MVSYVYLTFFKLPTKLQFINYLTEKLVTEQKRKLKGDDNIYYLYQ